MRYPRQRKGAPVAIVTGAGKRLGKHIALSLARSGYDVVVNYNRSKKEAAQTANEIRLMGRQHLLIRADVTKSNEVTNMVQRTIKEFGRIDVLVNNSAIFVESKLEDITEDIWDTTLNINLRGTFLCSQRVIPHMLKEKSGIIINIASLGGIQAWPNHLPYSVSKAGVIMLTKCLAKLAAPYIRVNAIAPGTILMRGEEDASIRHLPKKKIPLKKFGKISDITETIFYLINHAPYITGQVIVVDGGRSIQ